MNSSGSGLNLQDLALRVSALESVITGIEQDSAFSVVKRNLAELQAAVDALKSKVDLPPSNPDTTSSDHTDFQTLISTALRAYEGRYTAIAQVLISNLQQDQIDPLETKVDTLKSQVDQITNKLQNYDTLVQHYSDMQTTAKDIQNQLKTLQDQNAVQNNVAPSNLVKRLNNLQKTVDSHTASIQQLTDQFNKYHEHQAGISSSIMSSVQQLQSDLIAYGKGEITDTTNMKEKLKEEGGEISDVYKMLSLLNAQKPVDFTKIKYGNIEPLSEMFKGTYYSFTFTITIGTTTFVKTYSYFPYNNESESKYVRNPYDESGGESDGDKANYLVYAIAPISGFQTLTINSQIVTKATYLSYTP